VSGNEEARLHAVADVHLLSVIVVKLQKVEGGTCVVFVIEGKCGRMRGQGVSVAIIGLFFLKPCRVCQKYAHQVAGRLCRDHRAVESELYDPRQKAGVIDVRVRDDDGIEFLRVERERLPIPLA